MEQIVESQELVKRYLLGQLAEKDQVMVEERMFTDHEYFGELLLIEDELTDDFVFGTLSEDDRERMRTHFLVVPVRIEKLKTTQAIERYVTEFENDEFADPDLEDTLREAKKDRDLLELLISGDWSGMKLLTLLRTSSRSPRELTLSVNDNGFDIEPLLGRLVELGLAQKMENRFSCTILGIECLRKIEQSSQVRFTP